MNENHSSMTMNAISEAAYQVRNRICEAVSEYDTPSAIYRPKLSIDGNQWCALYGDNLQEGVAGFGHSLYQAMIAFDKAWYAKLD